MQGALRKEYAHLKLLWGSSIPVNHGIAPSEYRVRCSRHRCFPHVPQVDGAVLTGKFTQV
ncbi:MAG: hypothetical protein IPG58_15770 [Acidobacteria bacterium]|nr:hypothetical protein [Acidobacteriota bacterium]